jgi:RsiW-degrading membrane proteinase PrsW (M82 family)
VLAAGLVLLAVGGGLLVVGLSPSPAEPLHMIIVQMFIGGLFGLILSICGLAAVVVGAWMAIRGRGTGHEA